MATTIYGTFPLLVPGKTETVSRNGLKRISGTILFKPGQDAQANVLVLSEGEPFPAPQVRKTDMGLLEMAFDAYQNTNSSSGAFGTEVLNLSKSFSEQTFENIPFPPAFPNPSDTTTFTYQGYIWRWDGSSWVGPQPKLIYFNWTVTEVWLADSYTEHKVMGALGGSMNLAVSASTLNKRLLTSRVTGNRPSGGTASLSLAWASQVSNVTRRNFGVYDEVDIVTSLVAEIL